MFKALTMDEITAQGVLFFIAGYDTTANALCWLIYCLACNPEIQEKVYDEIQEVIGNNVSRTWKAPLISLADLNFLFTNKQQT